MTSYLYTASANGTASAFGGRPIRQVDFSSIVRSFSEDEEPVVYPAPPSRLTIMASGLRALRGPFSEMIGLLRIEALANRYEDRPARILNA